MAEQRSHIHAQPGRAAEARNAAVWPKTRSVEEVPLEFEPQASPASESLTREQYALNLQHTVGNHAVEQWLSQQIETASKRDGLADHGVWANGQRAGSQPLTVQREDESIWDWFTDQGNVWSKARQGRTVLSGAARTARNIANEAAATERTSSLQSMVKSLGSTDPEDFWAASNAYEQAASNQTVKGAVASALESTTGKGSVFGNLMGGANYGLQFLSNISKGQDVGESASGAAAGGFVGNRVRGGGWDTAINLANAGLQLLGAPKEATQFTQVAADATPSGFATSLASNAGRGVWNLGKGLISGDWSSLEKQGQDIVQGRAGAPLQGYGMLTNVLSGADTDWMTSNQAKSGDYGVLPALGNFIGDEWSDANQQYGGFGGTLKEFGSEFGDFLWEGATGEGGIKSAANWVEDKASGAWDWTKGVASDAGSAIAGAAGSAYDWASDKVSNAGSAISGAASDAWDWLTDW